MVARRKGTAAKPSQSALSSDWTTWPQWHECTARQVTGLVAKVLGDEWEEPFWEVLQDDERRFKAIGPAGGFVEQDRKGKWTHLAFKGTACGVIGTEKLVELCQLARRTLGPKFKATRVDLAWDDYGKQITPHRLRQEFWDAEKNGKREQVVCRAKVARFHEDDPLGSGCSYYIGARTSERMVRLYDKSAQSGGEIDAMRVELQTRGDSANAVLTDLVQSDADWTTVALRHLVGFLDFRVEESYRSHVERRTRCGWWSDFVGSAEKATISRPEPQSLEGWIESFKRQNGSGFGVLLEMHAGDVEEACQALLSVIPRKQNPKHARMRQEIRRARRLGEEVV